MPMLAAGTMKIERTQMHGRAVSGMPGESIAREVGIELTHDPISRYLRHDRRGGDAEAVRVAIDQADLGSGVLHEEGVAKEHIGLEWKIEHCSLESDTVRWPDAEQVNLACVDHADSDPDGRVSNDTQRPFALTGAERF